MTTTKTCVVAKASTITSNDVTRTPTTSHITTVRSRQKFAPANAVQRVAICRPKSWKLRAGRSRLAAPVDSPAPKAWRQAAAVAAWSLYVAAPARVTAVLPAPTATAAAPSALIVQIRQLAAAATRSHWTFHPAIVTSTKVKCMCSRPYPTSRSRRCALKVRRSVAVVALHRLHSKDHLTRVDPPRLRVTLVPATNSRSGSHWAKTASVWQRLRASLTQNRTSVRIAAYRWSRAVTPVK